MAFYLLKTYQRFTGNLPEIYRKFTNDLPSLPVTYQKLTESIFLIYQKFTNALPKMFGQKYFETSIMYFLKNILLQSISTSSFDENWRFDCS